MDFREVYRSFESTNLIDVYESNAFMLWALSLQYQIEDLDVFAYENLTDGSDDKKCDLIWVNRDENEAFAIIGQGYFKGSNFDHGGAPSNKASDLNTAVTWVLGSVDISEIPERIRAGVTNLREALESNEIKRIFIDYYHNMPESEHVSRELHRVYETAKSFLDRKGYSDVDIECREIGQQTVVEWYLGANTTILITDQLRLPFEEGYLVETGQWRAISTFIHASTLYRWFNSYSDKLFSANKRSYLGWVRRDSNINAGIKKSAMEQPSNFFAFHNGITVLVNKFEVKGDELIIDGLSIVNGAQTTGSIGNLDETPDENIKIACRFIQCSDPNIVQDIVIFNNSQNKMIPSDFRSTDAVQKRLVQEFEKYAGRVNYSGARRGGSTDAISRDPNMLSSDKVAQSLTAFHGNPQSAYSDKGKIWKENEKYDMIFNTKTTAKHIVFVSSLYMTIINTHHEIKSLIKNEVEITSDQQKQFDFLSKRGSAYLLVHAISLSLETILGTAIPDKFLIEFDRDYTFEACIKLWKPVIGFSLRFCHLLEKGLEKYSFTMEDVEEPVNNYVATLQSVIEQLKKDNLALFNEFSTKTKVRA